MGGVGGVSASGRISGRGFDGIESKDERGYGLAG